MNSILTSIKQMLGIEADCTDFDGSITAHINTVLFVLGQNGIGPEDGFVVTSEMETWDMLVDDEALQKLQAIKTYVYCKVKLVFDPPQSSSHLEALKRTADELEWRLNIQAESIDSDETIKS